MDHISNISFIVIALNEQFAIEHCLSSITNMNLSNCEVICVDSGSTDATLSIMKRYQKNFQNFRIFSINGYTNASIARNVGIRHAVKKYIFFVDGDLDLSEDFTKNGLQTLQNKCDAVMGPISEKYYEPGFNKLLQKYEPKFNFSEGKITYFSGGCFFAKRDAVNKTGFFDERLECFEDGEYTLRLTRKHTMMKLPIRIGIHHTVPYHNISRIAKSLKQLSPVFLGMVLRKNIFNFKGSFDYFKIVSLGAILGFLLTIIYLLSFFFIPAPFNILTILTILLTDILHGWHQKKNILYRMVLHYINPLFMLTGFFFNLDKRKNNVVVEIKPQKSMLLSNPNVLSISVIIPTKNRSKELKECIDSILKQSKKPFEIVVVDSSDNNSTYDLVEKYKSSSNINMVYAKTIANTSFQRNEGTKLSKGDLIFFTDDDCILDIKTIEEISRFFQKDINRSLGGAELNIDHAHIQNTILEKMFYRFFLMNDDRIIGNILKPDFLFTDDEAESIQHTFGAGCVFYRNVFLENLADINYSSFSGYEMLGDFDFSFRINLKFPLVRIKEAKTFHKHTPSTRMSIFDYEYLSVVQHFKIYNKYFKIYPKERIIFLWRICGDMLLGSIKAIKYMDYQYLNGVLKGYLHILQNKNL
ncbi:MAG: glycosyltransferase [Candidatus Aureabacteria bacterium]|nr:glycosyltransferase [Candidatus Auribacterota bacterium]